MRPSSDLRAVKIVKDRLLAVLLPFTLLPSSLFALHKPPREAPPPPPQESQGQNPHPGFAWKGGYYKWTGTHYRWSQGHWVSPPRPGGAWVPGNWVKRSDHWEYVDGHWKY